MLLPQLEALNADIMVLSADTDCEKRKRDAAHREVSELQDKLHQVRMPCMRSSMAACTGRSSRHTQRSCSTNCRTLILGRTVMRAVVPETQTVKLRLVRCQKYLDGQPILSLCFTTP